MLSNEEPVETNLSKQFGNEEKPAGGSSGSAKNIPAKLSGGRIVAAGDPGAHLRSPLAGRCSFRQDGTA